MLDTSRRFHSTRNKLVKTQAGRFIKQAIGDRIFRHLPRDISYRCERALYLPFRGESDRRRFQTRFAIA